MRSKLVGGLLAVVLLAGCAIRSNQPAPLTVGAIYPLSGSQGSGGREELGGVQAALHLLSSELGNRHIQLQIEDVQTPAGTKAAVDNLIDNYHVPLILGTYGSTLAEAAAARADQRHVLYWESGAVADLVTQHRDYVFRTVATGMTLGNTAVHFTHDVLLPADHLQPAQARAVIVSVDDTYGRSVGDGEEALAHQLGIPVVDRIRYSTNAVDPTAIAQRISADHPDYLWDVSYLDDGIAIWRAVRQRGIPLRAAVGTSSAFCMEDFGKKLGKEAIGVFAADKPDDQVSPKALAPAAQQLLKRAESAYASQRISDRMSLSAVAGFVAGWTLFHDVLPRVKGEITPDHLRTAAYQIDQPMGTSINGGGVKFAPAGAENAGQNLRAPSMVGQWQKVQDIHTVYPPGFATASIISLPPPAPEKENLFPQNSSPQNLSPSSPPLSSPSSWGVY
ncbi:MAG: ABC transporter substrate-binding protein [Candidatus Dormibacteraceae bacterium]